MNLPHVAAAIEERDTPQLAGRPLAIEAPHPGPRVVYDLSKTAHRVGVRRGMSLTQARKVCPEITVLPPRIDAYRDTFRALLDVLTGFTSAVEPADLERTWLSIAGLVARGGLERTLAKELTGQIRAEVDLASKVGLAHGKLTSRIVTQTLLHDDVMVLPPGREVAFLGGLAVTFLPVTDNSIQSLIHLGLSKVRQFAALPSRGILPRFGYEGLRAYRLAHGQDDPRVQSFAQAPFFESEHVLLEPIADLELLGRLLTLLAAEVARPLSEAFQMARQLRLTLMLDDGRRIERERTMDEPAVSARILLGHATTLVSELDWEPNVGIERVQLAVQGLCPTVGRQLDMFRRDQAAKAGVEETLRRLQAKYGPEIVQRGQPLEPESTLPERRTYLSPWGADARSQHSAAG